MATAVALGGGHAPAPRVDLVVPKGSVRAVAGALAGSFVVRNAGRGRTGASTAALTVTVAGRSRRIKRYAVPPLRRGASRTFTVAVALPAALPAGTFPV